MRGHFSYLMIFPFPYIISIHWSEYFFLRELVGYEATDGVLLLNKPEQEEMKCLLVSSPFLKCIDLIRKGFLQLEPNNIFSY